MTEIVSNEKLSSRELVAPPRFADTEDYLASLLFGSNSATVELGTKFKLLNPGLEVITDARFF